jgi:hypothetical protein
MTERHILPSPIRLAARPGERARQNFVIQGALPNGSLVASIEGGGGLFQLEEFAAYEFVADDAPDNGWDDGPPDRPGLGRPGSYVQVARASAGQPLPVSFGQIVDGYIVCDVPGDASPSTLSAKLTMAGLREQPVEVPLVLLIGRIVVEFLVSPIVAHLDQWTDVPVRVSIPGAHQTQVTLQITHGYAETYPLTLLVPEGGSATGILKLRVSGNAPLGQLASGLTVSGLSDGFTILPVDIVVEPPVIDNGGLEQGSGCGTPSRNLSGIQIQTFGSPGGQWSRGRLTFSIDPSGANLPAAVVNTTITRAFALWQAIIPFFFNFQQVPAGGDIRAAFGGPEANPQLTKGGKLGVGSFPEKGMIFFNKSVPWTAASLFSVALHEVGHALGLAHSDSRTSLMYPYDLNMATIDAESAESLRLNYGWRPQIPLSDRATSAQPALGVSSSVTLTSATSTLHMAWKGSRDDGGIYESSLINNTWTPQRLIPGRATSSGPALASLPLNDGTPSTGLIMAWKGSRNDQGLYYATKGFGDWSAQQKVPGVGTADRPALALFNGIWMAWRGVDGDQGLYWSTLGPAGWSDQRNIRGVGSSVGPAMAVLNNRLYMFWKGIKEDSRLYYSWLDALPAAIWKPQRVVAYVDSRVEGEIWKEVASSSAPSATVRGNRILLSWKGVQDSGIYFSLFDGQSFTGQIHVANVGTSRGPCVCTIGDFTHMVWKGIEGDNILYWSTL